MTDLTSVLPSFPTQKYIRLLPKLEKNLITTADLLTLDCVEIAKRAQLPLLDIKRLSNDILEALQGDLGLDEKEGGGSLRKTGKDVVEGWNMISTLDDELDRALGGGIPVGYITEITGESGAGKTQFLLTLLLSAQLSPLAPSTLYISTESALPTTRLSQLLTNHPSLTSGSPKPTLDKVISIITPDLESQDHILRYQVPVAIRRHSIRLLILDSVAANYRAEFERASTNAQAANMAQRSAELVRLGQLLRDLAREYKIAVVVANQVADRFSSASSFSAANSERTDGPSPLLNRQTQSSPLARRSAPAGIPSSSLNIPSSSIAAPSSRPFQGTSDPLSLDHQQRWFTGWGDSLSRTPHIAQKTPSLGLIWTTQIACRIALIKKPVYGPGVLADEETERGEPVLRKWRRWMKVVFAPHVGGTGPGIKGAVEFEILGRGIVAVKKKGQGEEVGDEEGEK